MKDGKQKEVYKKLEGYIKRGEQEKFKTLFEKYGVSYFKEFRMKDTGLLHCLFIYNLMDLIEWIVEAGWDANEVDETGNNLLFFTTALKRFPKLVDFLIKKGMDVNCIGMFGYTPILHALNVKNSELARKLYGNRADINAETDDGKDIFYFVCKQNEREKEWIDLLLSEPDRCDEDLLKKLKERRLKDLLV